MRTHQPPLPVDGFPWYQQLERMAEKLRNRSPEELNAMEAAARREIERANPAGSAGAAEMALAAITCMRLAPVRTRS